MPKISITAINASIAFSLKEYPSPENTPTRFTLKEYKRDKEYNRLRNDGGEYIDQKIVYPRAKKRMEKIR